MLLSDRKESPIRGITGLGGGIASYIFYGTGSGGGEYEISKSLRFSSADSSGLYRTPSTESNRSTWTWSGWVKRGAVSGDNQPFLTANDGPGESFFVGWHGYYNDGREDCIEINNVGGVGDGYITDNTFRDTAAWYHIVLALDTTQDDSTQRIKLWVNGVAQTWQQTSNAPSQGALYKVNSISAHSIGNTQNSWTGQGILDSYVADVYFIDGQALPASDFGEFDSNGLWQPKTFTGTYSENIVYSNISSISNGSAAGAHPLTQGFNGDLNNRFEGDTVGAYVEIPYTATVTAGSVEVYAAVAGGTPCVIQLYNGNTLVETQSSGTPGSRWHNPTTYTGDITKLRISRTSRAPEFNAIRINGVILQDNMGLNSYRLNFSDTSSSTALGTDTSGNGNNWTVVNLDATPSTTTISRLRFKTDWNWMYVSAIEINGTQLTTGTLDNSGGVWTDPDKWKNTLFGAGNETYSQAARQDWFDVTLSTPIADFQNIKIYVYLDSIAGSTTNVFELELFFSDGNSIKREYAGNTDAPNGNFNQRSWQDFGNYLVFASSYLDSPTPISQTDTGVGGQLVGNYATLNPLDDRLFDNGPTYTLSNGNLTCSMSGGSANASKNRGLCTSNWHIPEGGKWYWEVTVEKVTNDDFAMGIASDIVRGYYETSNNPKPGAYLLRQNGVFFHPTGQVNSSATYTDGDIIGIAVDFSSTSSGSIEFYKNGTSIYSFPVVRAQGPFSFAAGTDAGSGPSPGYVIHANFGQRQFSDAAPTGYKCLCSLNLTNEIPISAEQFAVKGYQADGIAGSFTGYDFAPGFIWSKGRDAVGGNVTEQPRHRLYDIVRGVGLRLCTDNSDVEDFGSSTLTSFNSDGFSYGTSTELNDSDQNYVLWTWNGGTGGRTYTVKVVNDSGNKYQFDDSGQSSKTLELEEGSTYVFDVSDSSVDSHPFVLGTSPNANEYSTGVTYTLDGTDVSYSLWTSNFSVATTRTLTITIPASAPTLYYWCSVHSGMGGQINTNVEAGSTIVTGSLNTTGFDQSQNWSANYSGNQGIQPTMAFDGTGPRQNAYAHTSSSLSLTFSPALSGRIVVYGGTGGTSQQTFSLSDGSILRSNKQYTTDPYWEELDFGVKSNITSLVCNNGYALYGIRVDGKLLVDSTVTLGNFPSIDSVVRTNPTAGFSMVKWDNPSSTVSVAHGLGSKPDLIITKARDSSSDQWQTYHKDLGPYLKLYLSDTNSEVSTSVWDSYAPTEGFFYFNDSTLSEWIAYCWSEVPGYSRIGNYNGNSNDNGPFVYTGFAPAFVMIRNKTNTANWIIYDTFRDDSNVSLGRLYPDNTDAESIQPDHAIDILSNGFKIRNGSNANFNVSGNNYLFAAFAEHPFSEARAR